MKTLLLCMSILSIPWMGLGQTKNHDEVAIRIIDRMTDVIGGMESCSFKLHAVSDATDSSHEPVKHFTESEVFFSGSNKLFVDVRGHKGHRQFRYNGTRLAYYSFDENNYGIVPAPSTTIHAIDTLHSAYGIEFPAADFFYPAFTDDLLESTEVIQYLGINKIEGKEYFHILAYNDKVNYQFWIHNDATNLPAMFSITYKMQEGKPQHFSTFSDWQINPKLPDAMFEFLPPPGSTEVRMISKNGR